MLKVFVVLSVVGCGGVLDRVGFFTELIFDLEVAERFAGGSSVSSDEFPE